MRVWMLPLLLWFWAGVANAQTVVVRAGEHENFTRLVFDLPERLDYDLEQSPGQARLTLARGGLQFDTTRVFQRVPRTRLTDIQGGGTGRAVVLSLACECELETFWYDTASLVVDIRDPAAEGGEQADVVPEPPREVHPVVVSLPPLHGMAGLRHGAAARQFSLSFPLKVAGKPSPRASADGSLPVVEGLRRGREDLLRQMARAASQGLLLPRRRLREPAPLPPHSTATHASPEDASEKADGGDVAELPAPAMPQNIQLRAETGIDRDMRQTLLSEFRFTASMECPDPESVDVTKWGHDTPLWVQLGPLRSRLVGEFDRPNLAAVKDLARLYIYFGFGAEARQTLIQFGLSRRDPAAGFDTAVLFDLAAIMEWGHSDSGVLVSRFLDCPEMPAFWAALSQEALPSNRPIDTEAILRGFSALPPHLRAQLGPLLARRFRDAGYVEQSDQTRRILRRNDATVTPEARLLEAEIALQAGDTVTGESSLEALVKEDAAPSADALLRLIEARLARDAEISYDLAQLAGAYAVEHRDTPLGARLSRAHVMALAASGAFEQAFEELPRLLGEDTDDMESVRSGLMALLTRRADDFDFLRHVLTGIRDRPETLEPEVGNAIARRLLSLGFPEAAAAVLEPVATGLPGQERKLLRAEIALERGRPRQAEVELLGTVGEASNLVRARARSLVGEHKIAEYLFEEAGKEKEAWREAWLGGDWVKLSEYEENEAVAQLAARKLAEQSEPDPQPQAQGPLARNRELIADSAELREAVAVLLASHNWPEGPSPD